MDTNELRKKILFFIFILTFLLLSADLVFSQNSSRKNNQKIVESLSVKLKQKVLLTDQQTKQVESILLVYLNSDEKGGKKLSEAQSKVEELLDSKQKVKYQILKADWWEEINKAGINQ